MTQKAEKANKVKVWSDANKETMTQKVKKENRVISRRVCSKETMTYALVNIFWTQNYKNYSVTA